MATMNRRRFLGVAAGAAAAAGGWRSRVFGANERLRVAIVGIRVRGTDLAAEIIQQPGIEIAALADIDTNLFRRARRTVEHRTGIPLECGAVQDFRTLLDNPDIDAVFVATPDHWHALATIWALEAGKHVYCEKPLCHGIWEGQQMLAAGKRYPGQVVQVGLQNRSAPYVHAAKEYMARKEFGELLYVRVFNNIARVGIGRPENSDPPPGVDYNLWLGPAPMRPFNRNHFHYNWHWFWEYSGGETLNNAVHQLDMVRFVLGDPAYPASVYSSGGKYYFDDAQETPDTQSATFDYDGVQVGLEQMLWARHMKLIPEKMRDTDALPDWPFNGTRIEFYGSQERLVLGRHGGGWEAFNSLGESIASAPGRWANQEHIANFARAIRGQAKPATPLIEGHRSTLLAHYANISYRMGRKLEIDAATELFKDDAEANKDLLVRRGYRDPFRVEAQKAAASG